MVATKGVLMKEWNDGNKIEAKDAAGQSEAYKEIKIWNLDSEKIF